MHLTPRKPLFFFMIHFCFLPLYSVFLIPGVFCGTDLNCGVLHILWPLVFGFDVAFLFHIHVHTHTHTHTHTSETLRPIVSVWSCSDSAAFHLWPTFFHSLWKKVGLRDHYAVCVYVLCVSPISVLRLVDWFLRNAMLLKANSRLNVLNFYNRK